ncbi:hypothetical protein BT96DRAFT_611270 [Gymnopus androsaceus JB14]|uniref:Uncharacterized protein n=1 Tax=Gymnopus androsaceus JB14 TaxID=1447944 RepID=A0A6A4HVR2_9AGAR|nr:hypothetical protein BT96DRAFT_611270 [Gymnopus androsaceus JB14]
MRYPGALYVSPLVDYSQESFPFFFLSIAKQTRRVFEGRDRAGQSALNADRALVRVSSFLSWLFSKPWSEPIPPRFQIQTSSYQSNHGWRLFPF